jgi:hypothetical protein
VTEHPILSNAGTIARPIRPLAPNTAKELRCMRFRL